MPNTDSTKYIDRLSPLEAILERASNGEIRFTHWGTADGSKVLAGLILQLRVVFECADMSYQFPKLPPIAETNGKRNKPVDESALTARYVNTELAVISGMRWDVNAYVGFLEKKTTGSHATPTRAYRSNGGPGRKPTIIIG